MESGRDSAADSAAEWSDLEAGLIQRARLLNRILADLYGPQKLLRRRSSRRPGIRESCLLAALP